MKRNKEGCVLELLKEQLDPITGESLGCYDTINTDNIPDIPNSPKIVYAYEAQSHDQESIPILMECVETCKVRFLQQKDYSDFDFEDEKKYKEVMLPYLQTNFLIDEIQNIILKVLSNGKLSIARATTRLDKDRFSALLYGLWYVMTYMDNATQADNKTDLDFLSDLCSIGW